MTKVTLNYSHLKGAEKAEKAIADIRAYLGDRFDWAEETFKEQAPNCGFSDFAMNCEIWLGITGYPVAAWYDRLYPQMAALLKAAAAEADDVQR